MFGDAQVLSLLESLVEGGVQNNSFREATVSVSQCENGTIHVNVEPGRCGLWGLLQVDVENAAGDASGLTRFFECSSGGGTYLCWPGTISPGLLVPLFESPASGKTSS